MFAKLAGSLIHISTGGPMREIQVNGKRYKFEMHPYCGPNILNRNGSPLKHQPRAFLQAASLWAQQGERIEDGLCRWDHPSKEILKHVRGKTWKIVGYEPAVKGE